jgi:ectoine hydroxylase-related dioxygenase (phytanoyl-CoA dioxygenase family)
VTSRLNRELTENGYAVVPAVVDIDEVDRIGRFVMGTLAATAGTRRLIELPWCRDLADCLMRNSRVSDSLLVDSLAIQCTFFIKSTEKNWLVSLHQDLSVPVAERVDSVLYSGWSEKEGQLFVQPPISFLERMLAIRVHLDDCDEQNGALRVVPGSHVMGRLDSSATLRVRSDQGEVHVSVPRGGAMLMRPLLLHASSKILVNRPRRVLHFVFAPVIPPDGLRWSLAGRSLPKDS